MSTAEHIYLAKANDDLVSHCKCADAPITYPAQMECPWCGCGWLFTCIHCREAFTFAKGVMLDETWEETAARDIRGFSGEAATAEQIAGWVEAMKAMLAGIEVGKEYVYLDGHFVPRDAGAIEAAGLHSKHDLPDVPQVAALTDKTALDDVLASKSYWMRHMIPADER